MGRGTVQPLRLSDAGFLKKLRVIAKDSNHVVLTKHAKQRMRQRRINQRQIIECLRKGRICEPAHLSIHGDWMATLEHCMQAMRCGLSLPSNNRKTANWPWL
jgi:hypothetical protein